MPSSDTKRVQRATVTTKQTDIRSFGRVQTAVLPYELWTMIVTLSTRDLFSSSIPTWERSYRLVHRFVYTRNGGRFWYSPFLGALACVSKDLRDVVYSFILRQVRVWLSDVFDPVRLNDVDFNRWFAVFLDNPFEYYARGDSNLHAFLSVSDRRVSLRSPLTRKDFVRAEWSTIEFERVLDLITMLGDRDTLAAFDFSLASIFLYGTRMTKTELDTNDFEFRVVGSLPFDMTVKLSCYIHEILCAHFASECAFSIDAHYRAHALQDVYDFRSYQVVRDACGALLDSFHNFSAPRVAQLTIPQCYGRIDRSKIDHIKPSRFHRILKLLDDSDSANERQLC